ncbi:MAG: DUF262 domain-containing protein [Erythrobacter sp.]|nr:DUF262 domain-containing protein [Erythrobacter sp.]NCQ64972.1 DUF262 domain-containing protein [Alphaproteobacteria bacterium]
MASDDPQVTEPEKDDDLPDPDRVPIRDRKVITQPYDVSVKSVVDQIREKTIYLRPLSDRPSFQRKYVWTDVLASRLIESILLNVPIPPVYLSQNDEFELDVIDGQQRIYSLFRFINNEFVIKGLEVLEELNGKRFFELPARHQRQIETHTLRCVLVTNESHPEIKFEVFERLNTNTAPLNAQELRNCVYRGRLNEILKDCVENASWRKIVGTKTPNKRMREEEVALRYYAFQREGLGSYRTPLKRWLNDAARKGRELTDEDVDTLRKSWDDSLSKSLRWFPHGEVFRRPGSRAINKALFDLMMNYARSVPTLAQADEIRADFRVRFNELLADAEFDDLISRAVDHTTRTKRRFALWEEKFSDLI